MKVEMVTKTTGVGKFENRTIDEIVVAQARVSSNKENDELFKNPEKLIRHLIIQGHWSPFDMCNIGFEIETSRAIGLELIRHFSIKPQQYSQRYSESIEVEEVELRLQSESNRQSSIDKIDNGILDCFVEETIRVSTNAYKTLIKNGVAREVARFVLPEIARTKLYMNGSIRSWITFLNVRLHNTAQKEIRLLAEEIKNGLMLECPIICNALYNFEDSYNIHILERLILEKHGVYPPKNT